MGKSINRCISRKDRRRSRARLRLHSHRIDEFATGYSSAGCTPAEPASASPAGFIFTPIGWSCKPSPPKGGGIFDRQNEEFSVGIDSCGKDRQGLFQVIRLTVKKRMRATLAAIRETLLRRRHEPVPIIGAWLHRVVEGYFRYYAVPTNLKRLASFRAEVCRIWLHTLRRRSQRSRMNWERFNRTINHFVPRVRVLHPYPDGRFKASHPIFGRSRMRYVFSKFMWRQAGKPHEIRGATGRDAT